MSNLVRIFLSLFVLYTSVQANQVAIQNTNHVIGKMMQEIDTSKMQVKQKDLERLFRTQIHQDQKNGMYPFKVFADIDVSIVFDGVLWETSKKLHQFQYEVKKNLKHKTAMNVERTYSVSGSYRNEIIYIQAKGGMVTVAIAVQTLEVDGSYGFYIMVIISIAVVYGSYNYYYKSSVLNRT